LANLVDPMGWQVVRGRLSFQPPTHRRIER
jgi:hypothetical protein